MGIRSLGCTVAVALSAALLAGCDSATDAIQSPAAVPRVDVSGDGVITGQVQFSGTPPVMSVRTVPCHEGDVEIVEESVIVNDNGTLRNVFVYLEGAPATDGRGREPVVLDQVNCRYVPHVVGVQVGQKLRVRSSDATLHNVHGLATKNRAVNFGMTSAGQERDIEYARHEFIPTKCDVHPWMIAYVGVFENPWFAITGDDGSFVIEGVPAGSYKLVTWHEQYGRLEQLVSVADDRPLETKFEYRQQLTAGN